MRLTNVALYSDSAFGIGVDVLNFSLEHTHRDNKYAVRAITGLDAEEIIPKFYGFSTVSKQRYYNMGLKSREIVMRVVLNPDFENNESYSDIRDELYRAISATRTGIIMLHFMSGPNVVARIPGFITKLEVGYFNQLPEVQVTVRCDDPLFRSLTPTVFEPTDLSTGTEVQIGDNMSTAPHGFSFEATFTTDTTNFVVQDKATSPEWQFNIVYSFLAGDQLFFSSELSDKYLYIMRSGSPIYLMDKVQPLSIWPVIFPGFNNFYFTNAATFAFDKVEYYPAYWGI